MAGRVKMGMLTSVSLMLGAAVYALFRPTSIVGQFFAKHLDFANLQMWLCPYAPAFVQFYLQDFLWGFGLSCGLQTIFLPDKWGRGISCLVAIACGVLWELLQTFGIVGGTGDWLDILMYFLAGIASLKIKT